MNTPKTTGNKLEQDKIIKQYHLIRDEAFTTLSEEHQVTNSELNYFLDVRNNIDKKKQWSDWEINVANLIVKSEGLKKTIQQANENKNNAKSTFLLVEREKTNTLIAKEFIFQLLIHNRYIFENDLNISMSELLIRSNLFGKVSFENKELKIDWTHYISKLKHSSEEISTLVVFKVVVLLISEYGYEILNPIRKNINNIFFLFTPKNSDTELALSSRCRSFLMNDIEIKETIEERKNKQ